MDLYNWDEGRGLESAEWLIFQFSLCVLWIYSASPSVCHLYLSADKQNNCSKPSWTWLPINCRIPSKLPLSSDSLTPSRNKFKTQQLRKFNEIWGLRNKYQRGKIHWESKFREMSQKREARRGRSVKGWENLSDHRKQRIPHEIRTAERKKKPF